MADQFFGAAELRVPPQAIPRVRAVLQAMLDDIATPLAKLRQDGRMTEPWLHDPISYAVMNVYNHYIMDAPDGLYAAMVAYRGQIKAAVEALNAAERHYDRTEGDLVLKLT